MVEHSDISNVRSALWKKLIGLDEDSIQEMDEAELKLRLGELEAAEKKLLENTERFQAMVEITSDWIWEVDSNLRFTYSSPKVKDLLGYEPAEIIGMTPFDFKSSEEAERIRELDEAISKKKKAFHGLTTVNLHKDGREVILETSGVPVLSADGSLRGYRGISRDVSERRQSEKTLRQREATLNSIFRVAPTGIGLVADRILRQVNDRICEMLGYSREELLGQDARMVYPTDEDYLYVGTEKYHQILEHGTGTVETRWQRKDGRILNVLLSSTPLDPEDHSAGITFTALDITDRIRMLEALRLTQFSVDHVSDAAFWMGDDAKFFYVNEAACRSLGYTHDELLDMSVQDIDPLFPKDLWPEHWEELKRRGSMVFESQHMRKDGTIFPVEISTNFLEFGGREFNFAFARDITDRKSLEAQLLHAQKMEAVGRLAGGVAHDFNNQLMVIEGYADMLMKDLAEDHPLYQPLEEVRRAGRRAHVLTSQLLAFSRKQMLRPEVVHLGEVLEIIQNTLGRLVGEDIMVKVDFPEDLENVKLDPTQFEQAIMNLVVNARDAMPQGGKLTIRADQVDLDAARIVRHQGISAGRFVRVSVADTGCGMDEDTLRQVFEPFFTTKEVGKGTGLGLSMVYGFVKQSGGLIEMESEPGKGTTFALFFPVSSEATVLPGMQPTEKAKKATGIILVVEDEEPVRRLIVQVLREAGYTVIETANAREALPIGKDYTDRIDLLIADVVMPGLSGPELAREILSVRADMKTLFISGFSEHNAIEHGEMDPEAVFLTKPFPPQILLDKVIEIIKGEDG
ncbi:MAG: hybrid sensor histidine kinase/response regulator [Planctomycetota bacterium]|jgi:PAS domain S-box-containing protein